MENRARTAKVLVSLVIAMTVGAFVLMGLEDKAVSAGAFSLTSYTTLNSIDSAANPVDAALSTWDSVEIYCARNGETSDSHFSVLNSLGKDGTIRSTNNWKNQLTCLELFNSNLGSRTIRVCVVTDSSRSLTDSQMKRTVDLVEKLSRKCKIAKHQISYPQNWQM